MTDTVRPPMPAGPEDLDLGQLDDLAASSTDLATAVDDEPDEAPEVEVEADAQMTATIEASDGDAAPEPAPRTLSVIVGDIKRRLGTLKGVDEYMGDVEAVADVERLLEDVVMVFETFVAALNETSSQATATVADLNEQIDLAIAALGDEQRKSLASEQLVAARESDLGAARIALSAQHSECEILRERDVAAQALYRDTVGERDRLGAKLLEVSTQKKAAEDKLAALPSWGMWQVEWMKGGKRTRTLVLSPDMASAIRLIEGEGVSIVGVKAQEQHGVSFKIAAAATV